MKSQQQRRAKVIPFQGPRVNPLIALLDHVARIHQRELKPTTDEQRLVSRCTLVKALLKYMDAQVERLDGSDVYAQATRIANARFIPTDSSEDLVVQLRARIYQILTLKNSITH